MPVCEKTDNASSRDSHDTTCAPTMAIHPRNSVSPPEKQTVGTLKIPGKGDSELGNPSFSGSMLNFRGVIISRDFGGNFDTSQAGTALYCSFFTSTVS